MVAGVDRKLLYFSLRFLTYLMLSPCSGQDLNRHLVLPTDYVASVKKTVKPLGSILRESVQLKSKCWDCCKTSKTSKTILLKYETLFIVQAPD